MAKSNHITEIINAIKNQVQPIMDDWKVKMLDHVKKLEKYCLHEVYQEADKRKEEYAGKNYGRTMFIHKLKVKKGWTKALDKMFHRSEEDLNAMIEKEAEAKLSKIDIAVSKKLSKINVHKIELLHFNTNSIEGYVEGAWKINDEKIFSFRTIYAGGYNVQCLHYRTIYKFK